MPARKSAAPVPHVPSESAAAFRKRLHSWFRTHARDLPWRRTRDPYRILISELMLQQTQVSRVLDFYRRFLERFPDLHSLAKAKPQRVLEAWAGLGYYARARNLHKLAKHVTDTRDGVIPNDPGELRSLPGVGAYTAGAVASFAYEKRAALVDTNVARVLHRVFAPELDPKSGAGLKRLWHIAEQLLPRTGRVVWTHNQALMELGALVCSARSPKCGECPVHQMCASRERFALSNTLVPPTQKRPRRYRNGR
ncbi:A/G-specific adenine glycosylase [Gemmatimonas sp.]|uniref:A/G-specific adenine glycosylase n=1 Tax=Gemmatimonas sp. TaxID=1962908 RepID=UPI0027B89923|nr:A/G-specific adenine glycosylase [Gemmatimonas sp.]